MTVDADTARHVRDLAVLCSLVEDPFSTRDQMTPKDKQRLRRVQVLRDSDEPAWAVLPARIRERGRIAYSVLTG